MYKKTVLSATALLALAWPLSAAATPVATATSWSNASFVPDSANVLRGLAPTIADAGDRTGPLIPYIGAANEVVGTLTDAAVTASPNDGYAICSGEVLEFSLAEATDLAAIRFYACWQDAGRSGVCLQSIAYKTSAAGEWIAIENSRFNCSSHHASDDYSIAFGGSDTFHRVVTLADDAGGVIALGAVALQFTFDTQDNDWGGYQEIEAVAFVDPADAPRAKIVTTSNSAFTSSKWTFNQYASSIADVEAMIEDGSQIQYPPAAWGIKNTSHVAGYTAYGNGYFGATLDDHEGADNSFPGGFFGTWGGAFYCRTEGTFTVLAAGQHTLAVTAQSGAIVKVTVTDSSDNILWQDEQTFASSGAMVETIDFTAAGDYSILIQFYDSNGGRFLEFAAAEGAVAAFSQADFALVDLPRYGVRFDTGDGPRIISQLVRQGGVATEPAAPTMEGAEFVQWLLNGAPYDFSTPVTADITLVAEWSANLRPVIAAVSSTPAAPLFTHWASEPTTLSASASDPDGDPLAYLWEATGANAGNVTISDTNAVTPTITVATPGTYSFLLTVSDGELDASDTFNVTFAVDTNNSPYAEFVGMECSSVNSLNNSDYDPADPAFAWGTSTTSGFKGSFRSTATDRKAYLLEKPSDRINAYGLDGYFFPRADGAHATTAAFANGIASNVTDYIDALVLDVGGFGSFATYVDDPSQPIGEWVSDHSTATYSVGITRQWARMGTIVLGRKVVNHPRIRIGFLATYGDNWKPSSLRLGGFEGVWNSPGRFNYGAPDWMFFDIVNGQPGDRIDLSGYAENNWALVIEGMVFDSVTSSIGTLLLVR